MKVLLSRKGTRGVLAFVVLLLGLNVSGGAPTVTPGSAAAPNVGAPVRSSGHTGASRSRLGPKTGADPVRALKQKNSLSTVGNRWYSFGPGAIDDTGLSNDGTAVYNGPVSGRVLGFAYDGQNGYIYLASADGGVWRGVDKGNGPEWTAMGQSQFATLSVGSVAVDPQAPATVFAGTGEGNFSDNELSGVGIYKSTDSGQNWHLTGTDILTGTGVAAICVDPTNSSYVYAAAIDKRPPGLSARPGLAVSSDGGEHWRYSGTLGNVNYRDVTDVTCDGRGNVYAAAKGSGVFWSQDHGDTWAAINNGLPTSASGNFKIALAPTTATNDPSTQVLYATMERFKTNPDGSTTGYLGGVWRTDHGGTAAAWYQVGSGGPATDNQAFYNLYVAADPNNADTVYVGLKNVWKSTDAQKKSAASWTEWAVADCVRAADGTCTKYVPFRLHSDQHAILFLGRNIYLGNDGGVWKTPDGDSSNLKAAQGIGSQLGFAQFYTGSIYADTNDYGVVTNVIGGLQDNGTVKCCQSMGVSSFPWQETLSGDGFYTAINPTNVNIAYGEYTYGEISRSTDGGLHWSQMTNGLPCTIVNTSDPCGPTQSGQFDKGPFSAPFILNPFNSDHLYIGLTNLWHYDGSRWNKVSNLSTTNGISAIAAAPTASNFLFIADNGGHFWFTTDGGTNWTEQDISGLVAGS